MSDVSALVDTFKKDPEVRKIVMAHSQVSLPRQLFSLAVDWAVMMAAMAVSMYYKNPFAYLASVVVIASRQHALLVLMHEASHFRLSKNIKINDWVSDLLAAYPTMISTGDYRKHHTAHHKNTNTEQDPDWVRKAPLKEWQYPQRTSEISRTLIQQVAVGGYQWISLMAKMSKSDTRKKIYWASVALAVTALGVWPEFLLYWMVPLLTLFPLFQRIRSISEHFGLPREHELNGSRNIVAGPVESFIFSPHNVNYHLAHHLFPSVPQYELPSLHAALMKNEIYKNHAHNNDSFLVRSESVFRDLQKTEFKDSKKEAA